jgi:hypothetical protein
MKAWHLVAVILIVGVYLLTRPPSGAKIARDMDIDVQGGSVTYKGVVYSTKWGGQVTRTGVVRHITRAYNRHVPIVTFHAVLTTGEFSDPEIVKLDHTGGGNYIWRSGKQPEGSLIALHFVPENPVVFRALRGIDVGNSIEIVGRDETRGAIEGEDGSYLRLGHANHKFVLVNQVVVNGP